MKGGRKETMTTTQFFKINSTARARCPLKYQGALPQVVQIELLLSQHTVLSDEATCMHAHIPFIPVFRLLSSRGEPVSRCRQELSAGIQ